MQSERWQSCTDIFSTALEQRPAERDAFVRGRCNGDSALRRGVELLLKYHDRSGDFIQTPAFKVAPELLAGDANAFVGARLGSYRIDAVLGEGGMGVVYLAYDERLERKVALKFLPRLLVANREQLLRLQREARTASVLNHPNIVTVHEIGEVASTHFIATEFIEGVTLRERVSKGPLPPNEALEIAIQIGSALGVAHRAGIVHRDIKPENIMLRPDGYVKVLDFGIAKIVASKLTNETPTERAAIIGTARYMSPEQLRGDTIDARTDLWSFGVLLYEMLAGEPPFDGATPAEVKSAVLSLPAKQLRSRALRNTVEKALAKNPAARYSTAEEMVRDLRSIKARAERGPVRTRWAGLAAAAALLVGAAIFYTGVGRQGGRSGVSPVEEKSVAVLPFENLSAGAENAFLADAIQDDVVTGLGKIKDLKVIAHDSVTGYRGAAREQMRKIGTSLGVTYLLQGRVRRAENRLIVDVALIDAPSQAQKWKKHYERAIEDALQLQGELATDIARELHATLVPAETIAATRKPTENAQAYLLYLRARESDIASEGALSDKQLPSIALYQQAVDLDPSFALARARLSLCAIRLVYSGVVDGWKEKARAEAEEARRLRPNLGEAHLALAQYYLWGDPNFERALAALGRAAELLPNSPEVPLTAAYIYKRQNRFRDRLAALRRAESLDPRNLRALGLLTNTLRWVRDWPEAMQSFDRCQAIIPPEQACRWRGWRAQDEFCLSGDINILKNQIAREATAQLAPNRDWLNFAQYDVAMLERDFSGAAGFLAAVSPDSFREEYGAAGHSRLFHEAMVAVAGNLSSRQQALEKAREESERRLAADQPGDENAGSDLAVLDAFLGRKADAIREAQRAVDLCPAGAESNEASAALAMVYAQSGEIDWAIDLIEHLLTVPVRLQHGALYNMTLTDLKWRWQWDPLRSQPRFQKILAAAEPKTVY